MSKETGRRSFLRLFVGAAALCAKGARAADWRSLLGIQGGTLSAATVDLPGAPEWDAHRSTRNTRMGALGERIPRLSRAQRDAKAYPQRPRVPLPPLGEPQGRSLTACVRRPQADRPGSGESIRLEQLGRLLHHTNGVTRPRRPGSDGRDLRAAPSAGALYSGEIYLVCRSIDGLSPGVYYYAVKEHALVSLYDSGDAPPLATIAAALPQGAGVESAAAVLLFSNVFARYTWRYANRGYRYALIDTGHISENLRLAAAAAGISCRDWLAFEDPRLSALLGLGGFGEAVCALSALGAGRQVSPASKGVEPPFLAERQSKWRSERGSAIERYHSATQLIRVEQAPARAPALHDAEAVAALAPIPLARKGVDPPISLEGVVRQRRSAAQFIPEPLSPEDLAFILEMAQGHRALDRSGGLTLYLAVARVRGFEPGLYQYLRDRHQVALLRRAALGEELYRACLRQEPARIAAVGFALVADLGPDSLRARQRAYRDMLIEAGSIAQRIYLAAEALGVAARNLAAFIDSDLNRLLGVDGRRQAVVHLTLAGPGD